jgi:hypothetical protein
MGDPAWRWDPDDDMDAYMLCLAADFDAAAGMFGLARSDGYDRRPGPAGTGGADEIIAANRHILGGRSTAGIERHGPRDGRGHPARCAPDCTVDHNQPCHGGVIHPEVERYLDMAAKAMGNRERPHGNTRIYRPPSAAERARARAAARPGHTGHR